MLHEAADDLFHQIERISLALMGSKRRNAYPLLKRLFLADGIGQLAQTCLLGFEQCGEVNGDGIAQLAQHLAIVVDGTLYGFQHLVVALCEALALGAVFVDMRHLVLVEVEPETQVVRP